MSAAAAAVLLLAVLMRRRDRPAIVYAGLTLAFGLWSTGRGGTTLGVPWGPPLAGVGLAFGGPLALGFAVQLTDATRRIRSFSGVLLAAAPLIAGATLALGGPMQAAAQAWAALGVLGSTALLVRGAREPHPSDSPERTRLGYLATAHGLVAAGLLLDVAVGWRGGPRVAFAMTALAYLYLGCLHLGRVRIPDLNQLLGNILALGFLAAGLTGLFAGLRIWLGPRVDLFVFNAFVASFVLLLFYPPIRDRMQRAIERRFVAGKVALEQALLPLHERLGQILTLDEVLGVLLETLDRTARVTASAVFLREDPHLGMRQAASIGLSPRARIGLVREPDFLAALEAGEVMLAEDLEKERAEARVEGLRSRVEQRLRCLHQLDAQLVLPLRAGGQLLGFWTLTDARSREPFSRSEVELLRAVADRAAKSIENSKTFERIRARDRLVTLGEMAAGLAHELRNPLATIRGALAMLDEPDPGKLEELRDLIVEEVLRLDRLIATFLDYAQPTLRQRTIGDLAGFVEACAEGVARRHADRAVALELDVASDLPGLHADADQLETVITNLLQNAYEALPDGGTVHVEARGEGTDAEARVEISVEDDGPGMDAPTRERAFVPFFTTKETGVGFGLALCERLVRAQGGTIELRSGPGRGTRVTIGLPLRGPEEAEAS